MQTQVPVLPHNLFATWVKLTSLPASVSLYIKMGIIGPVSWDSYENEWDNVCRISIHIISAMKSFYN